MKIKDEITEKDIRKHLEKLSDEKDQHLKACVIALLHIVIYKKLVTQKELEELVKTTKEGMVKKWTKELMEKPEELDKLKAMMWFEDLMKPKEEQK